MSVLPENVKLLLIDIEQFLKISLKDVKLNTTQAQAKKDLVERLREYLENQELLLLEQKEDKDETQTMAGGNSSNESNESDCPQIAAIDLKPTLAGWLNKKRKPGVKAKLGAQRRWCCIKEGYFYYYLKDVSTKPQGRFFLQGYNVLTQITEKELHLELVSEGRRTYEFDTSEKHLYDYWIEGVKKEIKAAAALTTGTSEPTHAIYEDIAPGLPPRPAPEKRTPISPIVAADIHREERTQPIPPTTSLNDEPDTESDSEDYDDTLVEISQTSTLKTIPPSPQASSPPVLPSRPRLIGKQGEQKNPPNNDQTRTQPPQPPRKPQPKCAMMPPIIPKKAEIFNSPPPRKEPERNQYLAMYFSRWDYSAQGSDELTVQRGDLIHIVDKTFDKESWWTGEFNGKTGLIPKDYLVPAYQEVIQ